MKSYKKIFYWSPFIGRVATIRAVIESAFSVEKFSKNSFKSTIINCVGEWDSHKSDLNKKRINCFDLQNKYKPNNIFFGYIRSRFTYILIFLLSFFPLKKILETQKPHYLIVHLITSLPLFLFLLFRFETKLILRISGYPKLNFFRKFFWKICAKKIDIVLCPTNQTFEYILKQNIFLKDKVYHLKDPIVDILEINQKKNEKISEDIIKKKPYLISIGRFTSQKNHSLLIESFKNIKHKIKDANLIIIGSGELYNSYLDKIKKYNLSDRVFLVDHQKNIFNFLKNAKCFVSTSLWEDPGFAMIESASLNIPIISSNCQSGPEEFIEEDKCGFLFKSNNLEDLNKVILKFITSDQEELKNKVLKAKKKSKYFSKLHHFLGLKRIIEKNSL